MQCPACSHIEEESAFGHPAKCPSCGAFYDKAVIARAKKADLMYRAAEREERKRKVEAVARPAKKAASLSSAVLLAFLRSQFFSRALLIVVVIAGALALAMRSGDRPAPSLGKVEQPSDYAVIRVGQRAVEARLKDADSAKFRNQFVGKSGTPCGEVNAKNGFGAYNGFRRYIASGGGVAVVEGEMQADEFEEVWQRFCTK
ncbi:hypothetical protein [Stutzerimonas stutzeri]|uniref:hypothetical protein n=1 Tax=Stutzerimonas stutzeri TaxID=316 RepID=UPI00265B273B|nr:hypothetical protein [Stutzerimonas stutzeri]MCF6780924.1 hypothetical protein [Stutzerimonas stutzeri]MCF6803493.1 hypothetical protein [Stutzerimonas stutzeri]